MHSYQSKNKLILLVSVLLASLVTSQISSTSYSINDISSLNNGVLLKNVFISNFINGFLLTDYKENVGKQLSFYIITNQEGIEFELTEETIENKSECSKKIITVPNSFVYKFSFDDCEFNDDSLQFSYKYTFSSKNIHTTLNFFVISNKISSFPINSKEYILNSDFSDVVIRKNQPYVLLKNGQVKGWFTSGSDLEYGWGSNYNVNWPKDKIVMEPEGIRNDEVYQEFDHEVEKNCFFSFKYAAKSNFSLDTSGIKISINEQVFIDQNRLDDYNIKEASFEFVSKKGKNRVSFIAKGTEDTVGVSVADVSIKCLEQKNYSINLSLNPNEIQYFLIEEENLNLYYQLNQFTDSSTSPIKLYYQDYLGFNNLYSESKFVGIKEKDVIKEGDGFFLLKVQNFDTQRQQNGMIYLCSLKVAFSEFRIGDSRLVIVNGTHKINLKERNEKVLAIEYSSGSKASLKLNGKDVSFVNDLFELSTSAEDEITITTVDGKIGVFVVSIKIPLSSFTKQGDMSLFMNKSNKETYVYFPLKSNEKDNLSGVKIFNFKPNSNQPIDFVSGFVFVTNSKQDPTSVLIPSADFQNIENQQKSSLISEIYEISKYADEDSQGYVLLRIQTSLFDNLSSFSLLSRQCLQVELGRNRIYYYDSESHSCIKIPKPENEDYTGLSFNIIPPGKTKSFKISSQTLMLDNKNIAMTDFNKKASKASIESEIKNNNGLTVLVTESYKGDLLLGAKYYNINEKSLIYNGINSTIDVKRGKLPSEMSLSWRRADDSIRDNSEFIIYYVGIFSSKEMAIDNTFIDYLKNGINGNSIMNTNYFTKIPPFLNFGVEVFFEDSRTLQVGRYVPVLNLNPSLISFQSKLEYVGEIKSIKINFKTNDKSLININEEYVVIDVNKLKGNFLIFPTEKDGFTLRLTYLNGIYEKLTQSDIDKSESLPNYEMLEIGKNAKKDDNLLVLSFTRGSKFISEFTFGMKRKPTEVVIEKIYKINFENENVYDMFISSASIPSEGDLYLVCYNCNTGRRLDVVLSTTNLPYINLDGEWKGYDNLITNHIQISNLGVDKKQIGTSQSLKVTIRKINTTDKEPYVLQIVNRKEKLYHLSSRGAITDQDMPYMINKEEKIYALVEMEGEFCIISNVFEGEVLFKVLSGFSIYHLLNTDEMNKNVRSHNRFTCLGKENTITTFILEVISKDDSIGSMSIRSILNQNLKVRRSTSIFDYLFKIEKEQQLNAEQYMSSLINNMKNWFAKYIMTISVYSTKPDSSVLFKLNNQTDIIVSQTNSFTSKEQTEFEENKYLLKSIPNQDSVVYVSIRFFRQRNIKSILIDPTKSFVFKINNPTKNKGRRQSITRIFNLTPAKNTILDENLIDNIQIVLPDNDSKITTLSYVIIPKTNDNQLSFYENTISNNFAYPNQVRNRIVDIPLSRSRDIGKEYYLFIGFSVSLVNTGNEYTFKFTSNTYPYVDPFNNVNVALSVSAYFQLVSLKIGNSQELIPSNPEFIQFNKLNNYNTIIYNGKLKENDTIQLVVEENKKLSSFIQENYLSALTVITFANGEKQRIITNNKEWICNEDKAVRAYSTNLIQNDNGLELNDIPKVWKTIPTGKSICYIKFKKMTDSERNKRVVGYFQANSFIRSVSIGSRTFTPSSSVVSDTMSVNLSPNLLNFPNIPSQGIFIIDTLLSIKDGDVIKITAEKQTLPNIVGALRLLLRFYDSNNNLVTITSNQLDFKSLTGKVNLVNFNFAKDFVDSFLSSSIWTEKNQSGIVEFTYTYKEPKIFRNKVKFIVYADDLIESIQIGMFYRYIPNKDSTKNNTPIQGEAAIDIREGDEIIISARKSVIGTSPFETYSLQAIIEFEYDSKLEKIVTNTNDWKCDDKKAASGVTNYKNESLFQNAEVIWSVDRTPFTVCSYKWRGDTKCLK